MIADRRATSIYELDEGGHLSYVISVGDKKVAFDIVPIKCRRTGVTVTVSAYLVEPSPSTSIELVPKGSA